MLLVPPVCLPVPNCCKKSAWFANRRGFGSSGKYGLCTLRSAGCRACVSAAVAAAAAAGEMDAIRKPVVDKAVIVGGGLGGLAAAIQLRKVGIDAQVYERSTRLSGGEGTIISVCPNGCRALCKADPEILAKLVICLQRYTDTGGRRSGEQLTSLEMIEHMEETYGQPVISILWKNALNILSEALDDDCKHMGYECLDVLQAPLVIGADGIHSVIRSKVFDPTPPCDPIWRAVIDEHLCSDLGFKVGSMLAVGNGRGMFVTNGVHGKLYWAFSVTDESTDGRIKVRSKDSAESKARLRQELKGWDVALNILEATDAELILERRVLDLPLLPEWTCGQFALLGDAAHAVMPWMGQGANLAFEDGFELALQLSSASNLRFSSLLIYLMWGKTTGFPQSFYDFLYREAPSSSPNQVLLE
ncbi:unnamed protein product [Sphagnum jensenii]|uniref:FAD-binding domain-containing protein n=1 Tax=Sphagnum jensenii TaxID=128206 RepID=A0ABP1A5N1_9BRYO